MPNGWSETVGREVEVLERPVHEDSRRADGRGQAWTLVDQGDVVAQAGEQGGDVEAGEPGADHQDVGVRVRDHWFASVRHSRPAPSTIAAPAQTASVVRAEATVMVSLGPSPKMRNSAPEPGKWAEAVVDQS